MEATDWQSLRRDLVSVHINQDRDEVSSRLELSSFFFTDSLYREIFKAVPRWGACGLWKARILAKAKIFL